MDHIPLKFCLKATKHQKCLILQYSCDILSLYNMYKPKDVFITLDDMFVSYLRNNLNCQFRKYPYLKVIS